MAKEVGISVVYPLPSGNVRALTGAGVVSAGSGSGSGTTPTRPTGGSANGTTSSAGSFASSGGSAERIFYTRASEVGDENVAVVKQASDDGDGNLPTQGGGDVDYATGLIHFKPTDVHRWQKYESSRSGGTGTWSTAESSDTWGNGSLIKAWYEPDSIVPLSASENIAQIPVRIDLTPYSGDSVVPNSVEFLLGGIKYWDNEGTIERAGANNCGEIDYTTGIVTLTDWVAGTSTTLQVTSLLTYHGQWDETEMMFRTAGSPLRPAGFQIATTAIDGELLSAETDTNGNITGDYVDGTVDQDFGVVTVRFGEYVIDSALSTEEKLGDWYNPANVLEDGTIWRPRPVIPPTARYNCVVYSYIPLPANILGLNPVRLPVDGRVPHVRVGDAAIIHHTATFALPNPVTGGSTYDVGRERLARLRVVDSDGVRIDPELYTSDLDAGTLTFSVSLDLSGYAQPLSVQHTIMDEALVNDVDVSGTVTLGRQLTHYFPATESRLSTAILCSDVGARATVPFSQQTWGSAWSDTPSGPTIAGQYNNTLYPIQVSNNGALKERWALVFTSPTTFRVIGETLGEIASGVSTTTNYTATSVTGQVYFTIDYRGWSSGWVSGNTLRFNTIAADYPFWVLRCVQMGPPFSGQDKLGLEFIGDRDA